MFLEIVLIIIGFIFLVKGADFLVKSATSIAKKFGLSEMLIGLTIVAIGTSLPEIFITITSSISNHSDLIIGNAIGSCICNFLLVIGIASLIRPIKIDGKNLRTHFLILFAIMLLVLLLGNTNKIEDYGIITKWQGAILLLATLAYVLYTIYEEKKNKNNEIDKEVIKDVKEKENNSIIMIIIYMILGILGLQYGSDFVVDNSVLIAQRFGLSEQFIGMTIVAIGTALPEIVTGIISARRNEIDLLLGNIIGSNIFNLSLLIGLGSVINTLTYISDFNISIFILILIEFFILIMAKLNKKSQLGRQAGLLLILVYIVYICTLI